MKRHFDLALPNFVFQKILAVAVIAVLLLATGARQASAQNYVTILYETWSNLIISSSGFVGNDVANMQTETGYTGSFNWWGKPAYAATHGDGTIKNNYVYYLNNDPNQPNSALIDYHADLLTQAKVDFITIDFTNGPISQIVKGAQALCNRYVQRQAQGLPIPQIAFYVDNATTLQLVKNTFYNVYPSSLFFNYLGKPLAMVASPNTALGPGDHNQPYAPTGGIFDSFTCRHCWALDNTGSFWQLSTYASTPPPAAYYNGNPEEMCAPFACQMNYMTTDGVNPAPGAQGRNNGAYFKTYMAAAQSVHPTFTFINSWNQWASINFNTPPAGEFVDEWGEGYSTDAEPEATTDPNSHGTQYYDLMVQQIALLKSSGLPRLLVPGDVVSLKSLVNGQYVNADNGGASPLIANGGSVGSGEAFTVVDAGNGNIALKSLINGMYVTAANAGANPLIANSATVGSWQTFTEVEEGGDNIALNAMANGDYVCADNAGASPLIANRTAVGSWETFTVGIANPAPSAPTGLTATAGSGQITLNWAASSGATSYSVYRGTSSGGESATAIATNISGTTYTNTGLTNGTTYYYKVTAVNSGGSSGYSNEASAAVAAEAAYNGPHNIPGTVQIEDYDTGGEGVAYHDAEAANLGGQYRPSEGVDIETCTDTGGGYNVGWTNAGEYMKYTVNVATAGTYQVSFRTATGAGAGSFHLQTPGGTNLTGTVSVPSTGGWQNWTTVTANVTLPAGSQVLELYEDSGNTNLNSMTFAAVAPPTVPNASFETPSVGSANFQYTPSGASWSFASTSGIQSNGSAWGAPNAPDGTQTAFLQGYSGGVGSMSQSVTFAGTGNFAVTFQGAQRSGQVQPIKVSVDGVQVGGLLTPAGNSFGLLTSGTFTISTAGAHTLTLSATSTSADLTSFVDQVSLVAK